ncbi:MAG: selenocysteine-specific translation elongation factor [Clostridiales bacterium]|jgi:selenocysteine-specific elongation factor|nr:selenocysteine-specific translation elongation factor [Clostridiales bacterium]
MTEKTRFIIGAAGHIDHGKTALVRALTGRDLDTLEEERRRGITISPGFTWIDLPGGVRAGLIDVPGHERFIKNMIAGAVGVDLAMLVVAANEGVKPQTVEHLEILETLGIAAGIIVLTKCGITDDFMTELCEEDVRDHVKGTFLDGAEIMRVDSVTGFGIDALKLKLAELSGTVRQRNKDASPRLNIDRVFTKKGFGAVVTGTLAEGTVNAGDDLMIYPGNIPVKARGIQNHETQAEAVYAGQRAAINLSGVRASDLKRGDVLAKPGSISGTHIIDVKLRLYKRTGRSVKFWDRLRLYVGARELFCRAATLEGEIMAGEEGFCQLRLEDELFCKKNDRFVAGFYSPVETIGGGVIVDPAPAKHSRIDEALLASLKTKDSEALKDALEGYVRANPGAGADGKKAADYAACGVSEALTALNELISDKLVIELNGTLYHADTVDNLRERVLEDMQAFHVKNPLKPGILKERLKTAHKLGEGMLELFAGEGFIKLDGGCAALRDFTVTMTPRQREIYGEIERKLMDGGFAPPPIAEITGNSRIYGEILDILVPERVIILDKTNAIHVHYYTKAWEAAAEFLERNGEMTLAQFRDVLGTSRKYAQLILERFDAERLTVRVGDVRRLSSRKPVNK